MNLENAFEVGEFCRKTAYGFLRVLAWFLTNELCWEVEGRSDYGELCRSIKED